VKNKTLGILLSISLMGILILPAMHNITCANVVNNQNYDDKGYTLFSPISRKTTYLIDHEGSLVHTWDSEYLPGNMGYMISSGCILRAGRDNLLPVLGGGRVQKITWDNELIWDFTFAGDLYVQHHDIEPMPNGNVLLVARELKTRDEAIQAGRAPHKIIENIVESEFIVEVRPTGLTTGEIVWEWHAWDHIIQNYDENKDNYGVVEHHPELLDINYMESGKLKDWLHVNTVTYNPELDQILLSSRNFNEIWIIDHSTTSVEASGHTGGNIGMGGDIIYRWGNPIAYGAGMQYDQELFHPHDAQWIDKGYPGEDNILIYNNGAWSVDEIVPPMDENGFYYKTPENPYGPIDPIWSYKSFDVYGQHHCGAQRLPDGNTLICNGPRGYFFEVTPDKEVVWEYTNPYGLNKEVCKVRRYYNIFNGSNPPDPPIISGPSRGKINERYNYTMTASDPENEDVYYYINWGDGKNSGWIGPYNSGETAKVSHIWDKKGNYQIKVKARDINLFESDWSDPLSVSMPKAKQSINLFQQLFRIFLGFLMDPAI
jgi:hypothetical protein